MTVYNFSESLPGWISLCERFSENDKTYEFTHEELRCFARCIYRLFSAEKVNPMILGLLDLATLKGLPHYDRTSLFRQVAKLLMNESLRVPETF